MGNFLRKWPLICDDCASNILLVAVETISSDHYYFSSDPELVVGTAAPNLGRFYFCLFLPAFFYADGLVGFGLLAFV